MRDKQTLQKGFFMKNINGILAIDYPSKYKIYAFNSVTFEEYTIERAVKTFNECKEKLDNTENKRSWKDPFFCFCKNEYNASVVFTLNKERKFPLENAYFETPFGVICACLDRYAGLKNIKYLFENKLVEEKVFDCDVVAIENTEPYILAQEFTEVLIKKGNKYKICDVRFHWEYYELL